MTLFLHALRRQRVSVLSFGVGLGIWAVIQTLVFPLVQDTLGQVEYPSELLEAFGASSSDLSDPRTYFDLEYFSLAPVIMAIFAVIAGTGALAGEESAGTIEFLATQPVSRRRLFLQKGLAVAAGVLLVSAVTSFAWVLGLPFVDLGPDLDVGDLIGATFLQAPFVLFVAAVALLLGAVAPSRSAAAAWTGGIVVISYLLVAIASISEQVEWIRYLSPYYYTDLSGILEDGLTLSHQVVLWTATLACAAAAMRAFDGRELGAAHWQWVALVLGPPAPHEHGETESIMAAAPPSRPTSPGTRARSAARRGWYVLVLLLALLGLGIGLLAGVMRNGWPATSGPRVLQLSGRVDAQAARVLAPTTGVVHSVLVAQGDEVRQGQVLAWITSSLDGTEQPVLAPLGGSLSSLTVVRGQSAPVGSPLAEVHDTAHLRAVFEVAERDLPRIATGQPVDLTITALGTRMRTQLAAVSPVPVSESGSGRNKPKYEAWTPLPDSDGRVSIGMRIEAQIETLE